MNKKLLVIDDHFARTDVNIYHVLSNNEQLGKNLEAVFRDVVDDDVINRILSADDGLKKFIPSYFREEYDESSRGKNLKDVLFAEKNNFYTKHVFDALSYLLFDLEKMKDYFDDPESLELISGIKDQRLSFLEQMASATGSSLADVNASLALVDKTLYGLREVIKNNVDGFSDIYLDTLRLKLGKDFKERLGVHVDFAFCLDEGREKLQTSSYDLVISDLGLPKSLKYDLSLYVANLTLPDGLDSRSLEKFLDESPAHLLSVSADLETVEVDNASSLLFKGLERDLNLEWPQRDARTISGLLLGEEFKDVPIAYFTATNHGQYAISGLYAVGKLPRSSLEKLQKDYDLLKKGQFLFDKGVYVANKDHVESYFSIIKNELGRRG